MVFCDITILSKHLFTLLVYSQKNISANTIFNNLWITSLYGGRVLPYNDYNDMQYLKTTKIIKTGTSLCVVIPKNILTGLKFKRGDQIAFYIYDDETIVLRKITEINLSNIKL